MKLDIDYLNNFSSNRQIRVRHVLFIESSDHNAETAKHLFYPEYDFRVPWNTTLYLHNTKNNLYLIFHDLKIYDNSAAIIYVTWGGRVNCTPLTSFWQNTFERCLIFFAHSEGWLVLIQKKSQDNYNDTSGTRFGTSEIKMRQPARALAGICVYASV